MQQQQQTQHINTTNKKQTTAMMMTMVSALTAKTNRHTYMYVCNNNVHNRCDQMLRVMQSSLARMHGKKKAEDRIPTISWLYIQYTFYLLAHQESERSLTLTNFPIHLQWTYLRMFLCCIYTPGSPHRWVESQTWNQKAYTCVQTHTRDNRAGQQ